MPPSEPTLPTRSVTRTRVLAGHGIAAIALIATSTLTFSAPTTFFFMSESDTPLHVGETRTIDVNINASRPVNAIGATISFSKDTLEIVGMSKEHSILDLWTEETSINEERGEVHFSGGTFRRSGIVDTGTIITLTVRAKSPGVATLTFTDAQAFAHDGSGTKVASELRTLSYDIPESTRAGGTTVSTSVTVSPSADFNDDGKVNIADVSILAVRIFMPYAPRYDLNNDGTLNLADLSVLFSRM